MIAAQVWVRHAQRRFVLEGTDASDHIVRQLVATGSFYELELLLYMHLLARMQGRFDLAVDVGANIGNHAVFFGAFVARHVIAIEPNPAVVPLLRANLARNQVASTVVEAALGAREGTGKISDIPATNVGMARVVSGAGGRISISTLDQVVRNARLGGTAGRVGVVKIDVEGSEPDVLRGAPEVLSQDRPHILAEASTPAARSAIEAILEPRGYAAVATFGRDATPLIHYAHAPTRTLAVVAPAYVLTYRAWARGRRLVRRWF